MTTPPTKYDVAISFLAKDEKIAEALNNKLRTVMRTFFFPRNQEELAGTEGLETMRAPFVSESRLNIVLYREGWGKTPWTRVEEAAIKDSCLNRGWPTLFFVRLDKADKLPLWQLTSDLIWMTTDLNKPSAQSRRECKNSEENWKGKVLTLRLRGFTVKRNL